MGSVERLGTGFLRFDEQTVELTDVVLVLTGCRASPADWSLGNPEFQLGGTVDPSARAGAELGACVFTIDERSLSDMVLRLTGVDKTLYPPGGWQAPPITLVIGTCADTHVDLSYAGELQWDMGPPPVDRSRYAPHRFHLEVRARIGRFDD